MLLRELISPAPLERCGAQQLPVLSMTMHEGILPQSDRFKKSLASMDQSAYKVVKRNQLVVGFPIDEGVLYIQHVVDAGIMSPAYDVWDVDQNKVNLDYLELSLHSPQSMLYYKTNLRGTTARRRSLPKEVLLDLPLYIPGMSTQKQIVRIISAVRELISQRQRQLIVLDTLIKARFVEMFGDSVSNPKGWRVIPWEGVFDTITGKLDSNAAVEGGEYPFFTCAKEWLWIDKYAYDCEALLLAGNNAAGVYDVKHYKGKFNAYQRTYILQLKDADWSYSLFKYQLEDRLQYLQSQSKGTNTRYLTMGILNSLAFIVPPKELQDEFKTLVSQVDKSKAAVQQALSKAQLLFDSLMQQYFG